MIDQAGRVRQRECAGCVCRGDFAGTVAHDTIGMHAPGRQQLHQRALDHEDGGLGQLHLIQLFPARRKTPRREGEIPGMPPPLRLDGIHHTPEDGVRVIESLSAPGPLGALPGEHHGNAALALFDGGDRRGIFHKGVQRFVQPFPVMHCKSRARGEMRAAPTEIPGQGVEVDVLLIEGPVQVARALRQSAPGTRRQGNHEA